MTESLERKSCYDIFVAEALILFITITNPYPSFE